MFDPGPAGAAFSRQSAVFDHQDQSNKLSAHLRSIYRAEVDRHLKRGSEILELNCGTGLDAMYFVGRGHRVLATDVAPGMISELRKKAEDGNVTHLLSGLQLSYHDLSQLKGQRFDHIVSNFGGLNCTPHLSDVLLQFKDLLKPGGMVTMAIMPRFCPWELAMVFKGKFRTAFRRWRKRTPANVEGMPFFCYYYNPSYVVRTLQKDFEVITLKGVFITVPPEFYAGFVERYPGLYKFLSAVDEKIGNVFPFNRSCDHYIITLQKKR